MELGLAKSLQGVSERLLGVSTDPADRGIKNSLQDLGVMVGAGRVYVFLLTRDETALDRAFEWCDEGVPGHDFSGFRGVPVTAFPWSMEQFRADQIVYVRDSSLLPEIADAERQACQSLGIGAYVNLPLWIEDRLVGWLGFDSDTVHPPWEEPELQLMRTAGRMLAFTVDRIEREQSLREEQAMSRRLAALGTFASGIGHEINNPLAYVSLSLELLQKRLVQSQTDPKGLALLQDARDGVDQIAQIVESLRSFSRQGPLDHAPVHLNEALETTLKLLRQQIELKATLTCDGDTDLWISAGPSDLGQLFANILQNALQALPAGRADSHHIGISSARSGDVVIIDVTDTGSGFPPEVLARAFEPFFTTRSRTGGSGIGLALCHTLATSLGGSIEATNRAGGGARIRVRLPVVPPPEGLVTPAAPATQQLRVLVVDDVAPIRSVFAEVLSEHEVVTAASGDEAISILETDAAFDVIVCDVIMANGTGKDVYDFIREKQPALTMRVVFSSGGADRAWSREFLDTLPNRVLRKPVSADELLSCVADTAADSTNG